MGVKTKKKYEPDYAVPPGETVQETLEHLGMTQAELAQRTGKTRKHINEIVKGKSPIVPATALEFERTLGVPARIWNNLEKNYRESMARIEEKKSLEKAVSWLQKFPVNDLRKLGILSKTRDKVREVSELLNFYAVSNSSSWKEYWLGQNADFRKSPIFNQSPESVSAWLRIGELKARKIECAPYAAPVFRQSLKIIRSELICKPVLDAWSNIVKLCAKAGVAVVCVPKLTKTHSSGAAYWLNPRKAIIQLSFRFRSDDHFWFTFFHEAGHILEHPKKGVFIDDGVFEGKLEEEANRFASGYLINKNEYRQFIAAGEKSKTSIRSFAKKLGLPPGIVVGRLQHDKLIPRMVHNDLKAEITLEAINNMAYPVALQ